MNELSSNRYQKQILFSEIGIEGQAKVARSRVVVIGVGALGTVIAGNLCRAGVGHLRLVDRDFVELSNLQRQFLFDEDDARQRMPKAVAAANRLRNVNSEVQVEPLIEDVTADNIERMIADCQVVLDGTDNLETRFLINDACLKAGIPWVYGGAVGASGMTMTIVPHKTPCLRCLVDHPPPPGAMPNCDTEGVLAAITSTIASIESAEALKLLVGAEPRAGILHVDIWDGEFREAGLERRPDCPACVGEEYEFLSGSRTSWTTSLCGRNAVQIVPPVERDVPLASLEQRLARIGQVSFNGFLLSLSVGEREIVLFPTGRAIVRGTTDVAEARSMYARYIGT